MKTNTTNLFMMLMVLAIGSAATVQAGKGCSSCSKSTSSVKDASASFMKEMHSLQSDFHAIRRDARDCSVDCSMNKLEDAEQRINALEQSSEKTDMHRIHLHTLRRELKDARAFVKKHGQKSTDSVVVQRKSNTEVSSENFLDRMHDLQSDFREVRRDAKDCSVDCSMNKLEDAEQRINALEQGSEKTDMHRTHIHTLRRELKNAREYVEKHGQKSTDSVVVQTHSEGLHTFGL